jgi:predicted negative regulator of RcsB-dependent stress response
VDEYISEKEQIQRIRNWWNDNGWYLIGGVVLGVAGIFGYGRYQGYVAGEAEAAAALYRQVETAANDDNLADVERLLGVLRSEYEDSAYTDQAALLAARVHLVRDTDRAVSELRDVMTSKDADLAMVARLRLARVLAYQEKYDEALALLDVPEPGPFAARIADIRGDIYVAQGDRQAAQLAFTEALVATGADLVDRSFVQMKLADLTNPVRAAAEEPAVETAVPAEDDTAAPATAEDSGDQG